MQYIHAYIHANTHTFIPYTCNIYTHAMSCIKHLLYIMNASTCAIFYTS